MKYEIFFNFFVTIKKDCLELTNSLVQKTQLFFELDDELLNKNAVSIFNPHASKKVIVLMPKILGISQFHRKKVGTASTLLIMTARPRKVISKKKNVKIFSNNFASFKGFFHIEIVMVNYLNIFQSICQVPTENCQREIEMSYFKGFRNVIPLNKLGVLWALQLIPKVSLF